MNTKNYIIDTNVLIHDPECLRKFEEHTLIIIPEVIGELDKFKTEDSSRGKASRKAIHNLVSILDGGSVKKGCPIGNGGKLKTRLSKIDKRNPVWSHFPEDSVDNRLLQTLYQLSKESPDTTTLVTKDKSLSLKAKHLGLLAEDYKNDIVSKKEEEPTTIEIEVGEKELEQIRTGELFLQTTGLRMNEWVTLKTAHRSQTARVVNINKFRSLIQKNTPIPGGGFFEPKNEEQLKFLDLLLDPQIKLVTGMGPAGTGKTIVALAAALNQTLGENATYEKIILARPVIGLGNQDIGFMPGNMKEKMDPWLQGYYDNLNLLMRSRNRRDQKQKKKQHNSQNQNETPERIDWAENLISRGKLEIQSLHHIRGRSIHNAILIVDESQNTRPHDLKTIITRIGKNAKVVLLGDTSQIDDTNLSEHSNGLTYVKDKLSDERICGHIYLTEVHRSELAEIGANKL